MANIVMIGAGSLIFGAGTLVDLAHFKDVLAGSTIALVDVDAAKAELMGGLAQRINHEAGSPFKIVATTEREAVLPDADFVITAAAIRREELWKIDWDIISAAGIQQTYGESGGPGALSHTLRNVPLILSICRDVERLAPNAWVINFTNPEARICMALDRHTSLRYVGLCHGIYTGYRTVSKVLGLPIEQLDIKAAGINHLTWMLDIRDLGSGRSVYGDFSAALAKMPADFHPMSRRLFDLYGLFPTIGDHHLAEFLAYGWEFAGLEGRNWEYWRNWKQEALDWAMGVVAGERPVAERFPQRTTESVADVIVAVTTGRNNYEFALDLRNDGLIANLPDDAIVEVPGVVSGDGARGLKMGPLPEPIAAVLRTQIAIQGLATEAAVRSDRRLALQALLLDPVVNSYAAAETVLGQLLEAHRAYVSPAFQRGRG